MTFSNFVLIPLDKSVGINKVLKRIAMNIPGLGKHTMFSEKLFLWLQSGPGSQQQRPPSRKA